MGLLGDWVGECTRARAARRITAAFSFEARRSGMQQQQPRLLPPPPPPFSSLTRMLLVGLPVGQRELGVQFSKKKHIGDRDARGIEG